MNLVFHMDNDDQIKLVTGNEVKRSDFEKTLEDKSQWVCLKRCCLLKQHIVYVEIENE